MIGWCFLLICRRRSARKTENQQPKPIKKRSSQLKGAVDKSVRIAISSNNENRIHCRPRTSANQLNICMFSGIDRSLRIPRPEGREGNNFFFEISPGRPAHLRPDRNVKKWSVQRQNSSRMANTSLTAGRANGCLLYHVTSPRLLCELL
jgi:hypothetical protein